MSRIATTATVGALLVAACAGGSDMSADVDDTAEQPVSSDVVEDGDVAEDAEDAEDAASDANRASTVEVAQPSEPTGSEVDDNAPADASDIETEAEVAETVADDGPTARWETGDSDYLFDQDQLHTYELTISEANLSILDADPAAEEYVEGSLTFEDETVDAVGIRYKGSIGSFLACTAGPNPFQPSGDKTCDKLSMKIKINWNDREKAEFYGLRRVQLHAMNLDSTLMHDRLGYWMFEQAGVAGPRSTHARLVINGEFAGLFAMTEQIDGRLVRDRFDDGTGNVYKEAWPFDDVGAVQPADRFIDALETNEDDDPSADIMLDFAQAIIDSGAATDPAVAREVLEQWTDLEAFIAYAVVDRAIAHEDGPFHWYCLQGPCEPHNFYWYEDPTERKLHMIPWDLDNAFDNVLEEANPITPIADELGETQNDCESFVYGALNLRQRSAACDPLVAAWSSLTDDFERVRAELFSGPLSVDEITERLDTWAAQIEPVVVEQRAASETALSVEHWKLSLTRLTENLTIALEN